MIAISAASPRRGPSFVMRVYPPLRSAYFGAISVKSLFVTASFVTNPITRRLLCRSFVFAIVIIFSARERTSLAPVSYTHLDVYKRQALDRSKHQHHFPTFIFELYFPSKNIAIVCIPCATAFSHSSILTINGKERFSNTHWEHL